MAKRALSLLLVLVLSLLCLFAVGCNGDDGESSSAAQTSQEDNTFYGLALPENLNYGGAEVTVLTTSTAQSATTHQIQPNDNDLYTSETTTAVISAAAFGLKPTIWFLWVLTAWDITILLTILR